jgi:hypothetical protein
MQNLVINPQEIKTNNQYNNLNHNNINLNKDVVPNL